MNFLLFLVGFLEKWTKREKSGQLRGSFEMVKRPLAAAKVLAAERDSHAATRMRGKVGPTSGSLRRSSQHGNVVFLFRFVFLLFRRLVYWTNKDPISV